MFLFDDKSYLWPSKNMQMIHKGVEKNMHFTIRRFTHVDVVEPSCGPAPLCVPYAGLTGADSPLLSGTRCEHLATDPSSLFIMWSHDTQDTYFLKEWGYPIKSS